MQHCYYFLEVGPNGPDDEPVFLGEMNTDEPLAGVEEGKDFVLERVIHLASVDRDAMRPRTKTEATKYRIAEVLPGVRLNKDYSGQVTRVLLQHPKEITDLSRKA